MLRKYLATESLIQKVRAGPIGANTMKRIWLHFSPLTAARDRIQILSGLQCLEQKHLTGHDPETGEFTPMLVIKEDHQVTGVSFTTDADFSIQWLLQLAFGGKLEVDYQQNVRRQPKKLYGGLSI